jgi:hypothetical protein
VVRRFDRGVLLFLLGGLCIGLWPEAILPPHDGSSYVPLPAWACLCTAQLLYMLWIWPMRLSIRLRSTLKLRQIMVETIWLFLLAAPFYLAAAYLSDITWLEAIRSWALLLSICPLVWFSAVLMTHPAARPWVLLALLLIVFAIPIACYLAAEFFTSGLPVWLRWLSPLLRMWDMA